MTTEEKAKAYDEAIERAKKHCADYVVETIFPELAEVGDEEIIRKAMIDFFKHEREEGITVLHYGVNIERMIAWLEKQDEQMGFWNVREYVLARDGHKCQHCKGKSGDKILNVHHLESRKTGGNAPNNLITLCETCHKAYHRGEFELKVKRGTSLRDAAAMNIMRWAVYNKAKDKFNNVHLTFGYITKYTRIKNSIEKTHCADAFCVSKNVKAQRLNYYLKCRCIQRHTRTLHLCSPQKGNIRRRNVSTHWVGKSRFQKYDSVDYNGIQCYISGSAHGRVYLRDINWKPISERSLYNVKEIKFISRNNKLLIKAQKGEEV